jgi:hypothetical protein
MMTGEAFPTIPEERTEEIAVDVSAMQEGAAWLMERGVGYDVAGIQLRGPHEACDGTIAEMIGAHAQSDMKENIERTIAKARDAGEDPGQAVTNSVQLFAKRDGEGEMIRVTPDELKKK